MKNSEKPPEKGSSEKSVKDQTFHEISIAILKTIEGGLPFDVYIRRAEGTYTRLFAKNDTIETERFTNYQVQKGISDLFVRKEDYQQYLIFVDRVAKDWLSNPDHITLEQRLHLVNELVGLSVFELVVQYQVDAASVEHASQAIRACIGLLAKDPKSFATLFKHLSHHPYVVRHSITTSLFALLLARKLELTSDKSLTIVGLGAFLHDIGMSRLPFNAEEKTDLTPEEWRMIKEHPQIGKRLLEGVKAVPQEVRMMVLEHHEQPNGSGYPSGLHDKEIFLLSKLVSIADSFSALTSKRPFRENPCSPIEALSLMNEERGKFDMKLLATFRDLFVPIKSGAKR